MSHEGEEDLLEYSDNEQEIQVEASKAAEAGADTKDSGETTGEADKKGSYVGIHSTGFKDFLLKPELSRAIIDCGFEHPSEGTYRVNAGTRSLAPFWLQFTPRLQPLETFLLTLTASFYSSTTHNSSIYSRNRRALPGQIWSR